MADIIFANGIVLVSIPVPARSSNPQNALTPVQAQQWQAEQDRLARLAYQAARPPSSAAEVVRVRR
jgi:hypothetical protein